MGSYNVPSPPTIKDFDDRCINLLKTIEEFRRDLGSGEAEWNQIRKRLLMISLLLKEISKIVDSNTRIRNPILIKAYDFLELGKLRDQDLVSIKNILSNEYLEDRPSKVTGKKAIKEKEERPLPEHKRDKELKDEKENYKKEEGIKSPRSKPTRP